MATVETSLPSTATEPQQRTSLRRAVVEGALGTADRLAHAPTDLARQAVSSVVVVNVDVDVNVASRATRAHEGADHAPARG